MGEIKIGTLIRIKPDVFYKGYDLSGRLGVVVGTDSYLLANFSDIDEPVKILRYEIASIEDNELRDIFEFFDAD